MTEQKAKWRVINRVPETKLTLQDETHDTLVDLHNSVVTEIYHDIEELKIEHREKIERAIEMTQYTESADLVRSILRKLL